MGTAAEKERRKNWTDLESQIIEGAKRGEWSDDASLKQWLIERGRNPDGPAFQRYSSTGPKAVYGPSYDFGKQHNFETDEEIPWQTDPSQTWYDPSVAENWSPTDPTKASRMSGFFKWAMDTPEGQEFIRSMGGNAISAYYRGQAMSDRPNRPDMSWWTEGNRGSGFGVPPVPSEPEAPPASPYPDQPSTTMNVGQPAPMTPQSVQTMTNELSGMGLPGTSMATMAGGGGATIAQPAGGAATRKPREGYPRGPMPAERAPGSTFQLPQKPGESNKRPKPPERRTLYSGFGL